MPVRHVEVVRLALEVRDEQVEVPVGLDVRRRDPHAGEGVPVAVVGDARREAPFPEPQPSQVLEEEVRDRVVRHVEVGKRVPDQVGGEDAEPLAGPESHAGGLGHVGERTVAAVLVEQVRHSGEGVGEAVGADRLAGDRPRAHRVVRRGPVEVVGDEEIEVAVPVEVRERGARAPALRPQSRVPERERPVPPVRVEEVAPGAGDQQVGVPVVVVVGGDRAHPVTLDRGRRSEPGRRAHVPKAPGPLVAIQHPDDSRRPARPRHLPALHEEEVGRAVAVVVEDGDAGPHRLHGVPLAPGAPLVPEGDAGGLRNVAERNLTGRRRSLEGREEKRHDDDAGSWR